MPAPYILIGALSAVLPPQFLLQALDDDSDGVADPGLFETIVAAASAEVNGILGQRFAVPFDNPIPDLVADATLKIVAETLYARRGVDGDKNPWGKKAAEIRDRLKKIAAGEIPLQPERKQVAAAGDVIASPAKTAGRGGRSVI